MEKAFQGHRPEPDEAQWIEADHRYLWHPFTQMKEWMETPPLIIREARGNYLIDTRGNAYLDGVSSLWVNLHGHRHPRLDRALLRQLRQVAHSTLLGLANIPSIQLARELIGWAHAGGLHRLQRVFYSDNGSTAVEVALKLAFHYWQHRGETRRTRFVALTQAYHGDTLGAVSVGGIDLFHQVYHPLLFPVLRAPAPYCYRCPLGQTYPGCGIACAEEVDRLLESHPEEVAAVILEPEMQAAGGMIAHPRGYLHRIREICDQHGVLLILDEVATGFGRTGKMFASEWEGVCPDLLALAKGITGGYLPLAATLVTEELYEAFLGNYEDCKTFFHGHSYTGNPLACAVALANLEIFREEQVLDTLPDKIQHLHTLLEQEIAPLPVVGEIRQKGLMVGIELVRDRERREAYPWEARAGIRVCEEARRMGVLLRPLAHVLVLMPPLSITHVQLDHLVGVVRCSIQRALL